MGLSVVVIGLCVCFGFFINGGWSWVGLFCLFGLFFEGEECGVFFYFYFWW